VDRIQLSRAIFPLSRDDAAELRHPLREFVPLLLKLAHCSQFRQRVLDARADLILRLARLVLQRL
jgi:hypothetical protein